MSAENRKYFIIGGIVLALTLGWLGAGLWYLRRFAPQENVRTFAQLQAQGVPMTRAVRVAQPEGFICVFGDLGKVRWTLPSGPPAYLFDPSGNLFAFTIDTGDSSKFQNEYKVDEGKEVALKELPEIFRKAKP